MFIRNSAKKNPQLICTHLYFNIMSLYINLQYLLLNHFSSSGRSLQQHFVLNGFSWYMGHS